MEELLILLKKLEADESIKPIDFLSKNIPIVKAISDLADGVLIDPSGICNWENIDALIRYGYYVFAVEKDRYGWLIGAISTTKGNITYG